MWILRIRNEFFCGGFGGFDGVSESESELSSAQLSLVLIGLESSFRFYGYKESD